MWLLIETGLRLSFERHHGISRDTSCLACVCTTVLSLSEDLVAVSVISVIGANLCRLSPAFWVTLYCMMGHIYPSTILPGIFSPTQHILGAYGMRGDGE